MPSEFKQHSYLVFENHLFCLVIYDSIRGECEGRQPPQMLNPAFAVSGFEPDGMRAYRIGRNLCDTGFTYLHALVLGGPTRAGEFDTFRREQAAEFRRRAQLRTSNNFDPLFLACVNAPADDTTHVDSSVHYVTALLEVTEWTPATQTDVALFILLRTRSRAVARLILPFYFHGAVGSHRFDRLMQSDSVARCVALDTMPWAASWSLVTHSLAHFDADLVRRLTPFTPPRTVDLDAMCRAVVCAKHRASSSSYNN